MRSPLPSAAIAACLLLAACSADGPESWFENLDSNGAVTVESQPSTAFEQNGGDGDFCGTMLYYIPDLPADEQNDKYLWDLGDGSSDGPDCTPAIDFMRTALESVHEEYSKWVNGGTVRFRNYDADCSLNRGLALTSNSALTDSIVCNTHGSFLTGHQFRAIVRDPSSV